MDSSDDSNKNFFKHVFNFDDDSKSEMLNILQYALTAIIPIVILNKTIKKYIPESDDKKGSLEISAEIVIQIVVIFMGLFINHRIITFIPTYSGEAYPEFHIIYIILSTLVIIMSLQTKLGEKVNVLVERIMELWDGKVDNKKNNKSSNGNGNVKISQPISGQMMNNSAITQSLYTDGTAINSLPTNDVSYESQTTSQPNYNNMYKQDPTPLVGAASPGGNESFAPMAANEAIGGSGFSSW